MVCLFWTMYLCGGKRERVGMVYIYAHAWEKIWRVRLLGRLCNSVHPIDQDQLGSSAA